MDFGDEKVDMVDKIEEMSDSDVDNSLERTEDCYKCRILCLK